VNKSRSHISRQRLTLQLWGAKRLVRSIPNPSCALKVLRLRRTV